MYEMHDLRTKDRKELLSLISELKGKLLALRFETATGQLTETHLIKNAKKDIAKIFTVLKEQEQGIVIKEKPLPAKKRFGKKTGSEHIEEIEHGDIDEVVAPIKAETIVEEKPSIEEAKEVTSENETVVEETAEEEKGNS